VRITFTGTGAANGIPGYFQTDRVSEHARKHGGKDVRYRAGAVIDGILKIDWGPDTFACCERLGMRAAEWKHVFFTHSHDDHFAPREFQYLFPPFLPIEHHKPLVYGNAAIVEGFVGQFDHAEELERILIRSFVPIEVVGYRVTPIHAYHKLDEDSLNLIFEREQRSILYATDTGVYQEDTWEFLARRNLDCVILDCTDGMAPSEYWGHLSCEQLLSVAERMRAIGAAHDRTTFCSTHHGSAGGATHEELERFFAPHGVLVAFDGLTLEV